MPEMRYAIINVSGSDDRIELRRSDVPFSSPFDWQDRAVIKPAELERLFRRAQARMNALPEEES